MSSTPMSSRDRRALFLGLAILVPALFYIWGVKPFLAGLAQARDEVAVESQVLARERALLAAARQNPALQHVADSAMRAMTPRLFEGRDDVMATAELVSHLGALAGDHEVLLQSAATRPAVVGDGGVRTLRVEIRGESDLQGILSFLRALEDDDKLVRVERIDISRSLANLDMEGVEPLSIAATIVGYAIPAEPVAGSPPATKARGAVTPPRRGTP